MRKTTALWVLTIFVLGIYYPVIFAGVNSLDDFRMLEEQVPKAGTLNFLSLFNPAHAPGYFRPLIILSYYFDSSILDMAPQAMHLENVLIHLCNTLLVLLVGLSVFRGYGKRVELAFVAACLFAMHPLNVEAVAWISGRTDLLATLFALLSLVCLYRSISSERLPWLWATAILCLIGGLAKETALFVLPAAFLVVCFNDRRLLEVFGVKKVKSIVVRLFWLVLPFLVTGIAYLSTRVSTLRHVAMKLTTAGSAAGAGHVATAHGNLVADMLTTYGFYVKKLFLPLPLNFAIIAVNSAYLWLGGAVVLFVVYALVCRRTSTAVQMLLATLVVMSSAFVISRAGIAWTPYAERYLYLPCVFFAFGVVDAGRQFCIRLVIPRVTALAVFVLLGLMAAATAQRAMVWQNNLTLYQDTIKKSPDFGCISNELAIALSAENKSDEALKQIEVGKKASTEGDMALLYVNQASILGEKKQYKEAYKALACTYKNGTIATAHIEVIKSYINLMERERIYTKDRKRSARLLSKLADLHELYYKKSGDTDHLYRAAQLALFEGDRDKAHRFFIETAEKAPKESMFKGFAAKMAKKTERAAR